MSDIAKRFKENPLLSPKDCPPSTDGLMVECLLNPGTFIYDGKICLLLRVAERPEQKDGIISLPVLKEGKTTILEFDKNTMDIDDSDPRGIIHDGEHYLTTLSHLRLATSDDGVNFKITDQTIFGEGDYESFGVEDCRVAKIDDRFYLHYTAVSPKGFGIGMVSTENWQDFDRHGIIIPPANKDGALIEEKINGNYYLIHRPTGIGLGAGSMWITSSPDMEHWGKHLCIAAPRPGMWDSARIGAGTSPIKTPHGWLEIYHGADDNNTYSLGALLLDLEDPTKVLARSEDPIMVPTEDYEKYGFYGNVVFTNGHIVDGDTLTVYYGASDEVICGAEFSINEILSTLGIGQEQSEATPELSKAKVTQPA
jgi:predicted GH43/DUF377 family glycosyl hydrolase